MIFISCQSIVNCNLNISVSILINFNI